MVRFLTEVILIALAGSLAVVLEEVRAAVDRSQLVRIRQICSKECPARRTFQDVVTILAPTPIMPRIDEGGTDVAARKADRR